MKLMHNLAIICYGSACLFIAGCGATISIDKSTDDIITLRYSELMAQPHTASGIFDWRLKDICPTGYEKLRDYVVTTPTDAREFVWDVKCIPPQN